jgi:hypothetical protein
MKKKKILILLKKNNESGGHFTSKAGLSNSANFLKKILEKYVNLHCELKLCVDANSVNKEISLFRPDICIIEAIWIPPYKMKELSKLWPSVTFVVRVHSKIPFLANEGIAIGWIKEYNQIENVMVSFNNLSTNEDFRGIGIEPVYLPNLYPTIRNFNGTKYFFKSIKEKVCKLFGCSTSKTVVNIGCFGAIRPLKNQLSQAFAAITYADKNDKILHYHINGTRIEQRGENVLKNLRELFKDTRHKLVEHKWMEHHEFLKIIHQMDLGLQVSYTESFNIVTADFVHCEKPIIVGHDTDWMYCGSKVDANNIPMMVEKIENVMKNPSKYILRNYTSFEKYYRKSLRIWRWFLGV